MDQPITDYRAFLTEAWQAVTELNEMQQREGTATSSRLYRAFSPADLLLSYY